MAERKVVLYISMSLDGFIATKDDSLDWLDTIDHGENDYGYNALKERVDAYIIGRKTYDVVMKLTGGKFQQAEWFDCYVVSRSAREPENGVTFFNGEVKELVAKLKGEEGKDIYCDGGGQIVKALSDQNLIDEYIISIIPVLLGDGKRLFPGGLENQQNLELISSEAYNSGLVQVRYRKKLVTA